MPDTPTPLTPTEHDLLRLSVRLDALAAQVQQLLLQQDALRREVLLMTSQRPMNYWRHPPLYREIPTEEGA
jgi:hypothetical protein